MAKYIVNAKDINLHEPGINKVFNIDFLMNFFLLNELIHLI